MSGWTITWLVIGGLAAVAEGVSLLLNPRRGTLSAQVKWLRARWLGDAAVTAFFAWLAFHWWVDDGDPVAWDFVAIAAGLGVATFTHLRRKHRT